MAGIMTPAGGESIFEAFRTGKYCDLLILCQGLLLQVHRVIVCSASRPLAARLRHGVTEAFSGVIDFPDYEPDIVSRMVQFMYKSSYGEAQGTNVRVVLPPEDPAMNRAMSPEDLVVHTKVYIIADKYDVRGLKKYASERYEEVAQTFWESPLFAESIAFLYENTIATDRDLKAVVIRIAYEHREALLLLDGFKELLLDCPEFGLDMLQRSISSMIDEPQYYLTCLCANPEVIVPYRCTQCISNRFLKELTQNQGDTLYTCVQCGHGFLLNNEYCDDCGYYGSLTEIQAPGVDE